MRVLVLGADGFIGRHIAFHLRAQGVQVLAQARKPQRLAAMGFATLQADLTDPATHDPAFWRPHLAGLQLDREANLTGADLADMNLAGMGLAGMDLAGMDLAGMGSSGADFARIDPARAHLGFGSLPGAGHSVGNPAGGKQTSAHLINCAGLLTGTEAAFRAVHLDAPKAALAALAPGANALLISAIGLNADTPFARWHRETEALFACHTILRAGLVLADTSYGGSSALRAFAALPFLTPVVGDGQQRFNPIHADDLALVVSGHLATAGTYDVGGPETLSLTDLTLLIRRWLGLRPQPILHLPLPLARALGRAGDVLRLGPISATAVDQLTSGVLATPAPTVHARGVTAFTMARPAGTQDLWQARLYLLKPLIRLTLAVLWLYSGVLGLLLPPATFAVVPAPIWLARLSGLADLGLALALMRDLQPRFIAAAQLVLVSSYTVGLTLLAPGLWADPFGGLLKNLPILVLILIHLALAEER